MRASCVRSRKRLFVLCSGYHRFAPTLLRGGVSLFIAHSTTLECCHCRRSRGEKPPSNRIALRQRKRKEVSATDLVSPAFSLVSNARDGGARTD